MAAAPNVTPGDLGRLLSDPAINQDRAADVIADAYALCVAYCYPATVPDAAAVVVKRVAARMYVSTLSSRRQQLAETGSPYGQGPDTAALWPSDKDDLDGFLRAAAGASGAGGAYSVDMLPDGYQLPPQRHLPWGYY